MNTFELRNVTKDFGKKRALDNVSVVAAERSIIGLVGRNGSGKTTLLRHISGLYLPTSGESYTFGKAALGLGSAELSRIGVMNQHDTFIDWMRANQFIRYIASFYPSWDAGLETELVNMLGLDVKGRLSTMSPGNLQKVGLIAAVCHRPDLLLLDEPLSDLDPMARVTVVEMLLERFNTERMTMVISSHMLHDIERIVDRIVFLEQGRVVADAPLDELKSSYSANLEELFPLLAAAGQRR